MQAGANGGRQFSFLEPSLVIGMALRWKAAEPDYVLDISDPVQHVGPGVTATFHGKVNAAPGYAGTISLSCANGSTQTPPTCNISPTIVAANDSFTVQASSPGENLFRFLVTGSDGTFERSAKPELRVGTYVFFPLQQSELIVPRDNQVHSVPVSVARLNDTFNSIEVFCVGTFPAGLSCGPTFLAPHSGEIATNNMIFAASPSTALGDYNIELRATDFNGDI